VTAAARAVLLGGPVVLAFFTGGYRDTPRAWAGLVAWALVAVAFALVPGALPRGRAARVALAGLLGLAGWTLLSATWAPVAGPAWHAGQLAILYAGALVAAAALLKPPTARAFVEPAVAGGALVLVAYGLSERLLPGLLSFDRSLSAYGRLEQPLTYWNAMGEVAALGVVLCARLAGDLARPAWLRAVAAGAAAPLGLGLYLTVSRGALFAALAGLIALVVLARRREQLAAVILVVAAGALAAAAAAPFDAVTALDGSRAGREGPGAAVLALLAVVTAGAVLAHRAVLRRVRPGELRLPRRAGALALAAVCAGFAVALIAGADTSHDASLSTGAGRYGTLQSNRYKYWDVARRAFADEPLRGVGAGGWAVYWRRDRPFAEGARDAHSLYIQTGAELGLVGLALLAAWLAGVALAARSALLSGRATAAGPIAGCVVWAAHVTLDWDFQMPAATLPALLLAGALLATDPRRSAAPPG
jgi:hypothetical protein